MISGSSLCLLTGALKVCNGLFCSTEGSTSKGDVHTEPWILGRMDKDDPPDRIDWREKGDVTAVRNQKFCGCCWAIAPVHSVEALHHTETGKLVELSIQEVLDCDVHGDGCAGGNREYAFGYISRFGITSEELHPFVSDSYKRGDPQRSMLTKLQTCHGLRDMRKEPVARIRSYKKVPTTDEALKRAVAINLVAVQIRVNHLVENYRGGIIRIKDCPPPTAGDLKDPSYTSHAVLVIGYDTTPDGQKYWIVKNSWGKTWGEDGYCRIEEEHHILGVHAVFTEAVGYTRLGICTLLLALLQHV